MTLRAVAGPALAYAPAMSLRGAAAPARFCSNAARTMMQVVRATVTKGRAAIVSPALVRAGKSASLRSQSARLRPCLAQWALTSRTRAGRGGRCASQGHRNCARHGPRNCSRSAGDGSTVPARQSQWFRVVGCAWCWSGDERLRASLACVSKTYILLISDDRARCQCGKRRS